MTGFEPATTGITWALSTAIDSYTAAAGTITRRGPAAGTGSSNANSFAVPRPTHTFDLNNVRPTITGKAGGVGVDYNLYRNKLYFTMEAFDFGKLNLRAQLQYNVWKGIYVLGGYQDILNKSDKRSNYIGAGLLLTNDDLKMLLTKLPMGN